MIGCGLDPLQEAGCLLRNGRASECLWFSLWGQELALCDLGHLHSLPPADGQWWLLAATWATAESTFFLF